MDQRSIREFSATVVAKMKKDLKDHDPKKVSELIQKIERYIELLKLAQSSEKKPKKKTTGKAKKKKASLPGDAPGTPGKSGDASEEEV
jgi:hypothetical protein